MTPIQQDLRNLLVESLELLASNEQALQYQCNVPGANVSAELFCRWFDDAYRPGSEVFRGAFTKQELAALSEFNAVFDSVSKEIGEPLPALEQLFALPLWCRVNVGSRVALAALQIS